MMNYFNFQWVRLTITFGRVNMNCNCLYIQDVRNSLKKDRVTVV